ncbi:ATP-binding protein [Pseudoalteromonas sp. MMG012]|nr:ATP-binding protein [Pseudoalteromonas sp. MMG012]
MLQISLPSANLNKFISTPLQQLLANIESATLCYVPEKYILTGKTEIVISEPVEDATTPTPPKSVCNLAIDQAYKGEREQTKAPVVTVESAIDLEVVLGHTIPNNEIVTWQPTNSAKTKNTNFGVIGTMGTGKTQCVKSLVSQLIFNENDNLDNKPIDLLIFDYNSDYVDEQFTKAVNAEVYDLLKLPYNPLSLFGDTPMLPLYTAGAFAETIDKVFHLGNRQKLRLENLILECYELAGIQPEDKSTWLRPAPTIEDLWQLFLSQEKVEEDTLYAALAKLARFKIFESDPAKTISLFEFVKGVKVIKLESPAKEVQNLVVALTLDLFYSQMQKYGHSKSLNGKRQINKMILVDEADNFMSQNFKSLKNILKEGRKYGVGVILSTQDITHFKTKENDYALYIFGWIVHQVGKISNEEVKSIFNISKKEEQEVLMNTIRKLEIHTSLYVDGDKQIKRIRDKAFWELLNAK